MRKLVGSEKRYVKKALEQAERDGYHERDSTHDPLMGMHTWNDQKEGWVDCPECEMIMHTFFLDYDFLWCYECFIVHPKEGRDVDPDKKFN